MNSSQLRNDNRRAVATLRHCDDEDRASPIGDRSAVRRDRETVGMTTLLSTPALATSVVVLRRPTLARRFVGMLGGPCW